MLREDPVSSLQRMAISAGAGDRCALMVWCSILSAISSSSSSSSSSSLTTSASLYLLHLTIAELLGTSGEFYTRLLTFADDGTCQSSLENVSVLECFWHAECLRSDLVVKYSFISGLCRCFSNQVDPVIAARVLTSLHPPLPPVPQCDGLPPWLSPGTRDLSDGSDGSLVWLPGLHQHGKT